MSFTPAVAETLRQALATVVAVPVTPLHADGTPDWDTYAALTGRLIDGGITVITPNGNTGEFYAVSQAQLGLCRADVRPPSRSLPPRIKDEIRVILASWGLL